MTTRGLVEKDFEKVGEFIDRGIKIAIDLNKEGNARGNVMVNSVKERIARNWLLLSKHWNRALIRQMC
jgi:glycine/serine hydroxymethyltransferase